MYCHGTLQAAFIYGGATVRDNILFGLPYDEEKYNYAIEVACLIDDLLQMPGMYCPLLPSRCALHNGRRGLYNTNLTHWGM